MGSGVAAVNPDTGAAVTEAGGGWAAPATVPTASETIACFARGSLLSRMKPACSHTPINVPMASNVSMNRNTNTNGSIFGDSACAISIWKKVGASDGGVATMLCANSNRFISIESETTDEAPASCGRTSLSVAASAVAATMPHSIEPRTLRACNAAVVSRPTKNTIRSGEAK